MPISRHPAHSTCHPFYNADRLAQMRAIAVCLIDENAVYDASSNRTEPIKWGQSLCLRLFEIIAVPLPRRLAQCRSQQESQRQEMAQKGNRAPGDRPRVEPHNIEAMRHTRRKAPRYPLRNQRKALWETAISRHLRQAVRRHGSTRPQANTQARRPIPRKPL